VPSQTPTAGKSLAYLPLVMQSDAWAVAINPQTIATRSVVKAGEIYYTTTITLSAPLPAGGHFYLSAAPGQLTPVTVDDELAVLVNGTERWMTFLTYPKVVEVPRSLVEQWAGQPITVIFRDAHIIPGRPPANAPGGRPALTPFASLW
jgi:hypothetical protein